MHDWFSSDWHFSHKNICREGTHPFKECRPFDTCEEMNATILKNINACVHANDRLFFLGDFCMGGDSPLRLRPMINCSKIYLIFGNHDEKIVKQGDLQRAFEWCKDQAEINSNGKRIVLNHYAMRVWNKSHHGSYHLYGHSHGTLPDDPTALSMDVGIDCNKENPYHPFCFDDIAAHMNNKKWRQVDHHDRNTSQ